jgi:DNA-binding Lrp family transcriptional regulator
MTPAEEEAILIALWQEGLEIAAIAQRLGIPKGTVQSRAHRLQARGLIQPRPKGGAYPRQKALARSEGSSPPVQRPAQPQDTGAVSSVATGAVQGFDTGPVQRLDRLEDEVQGLRQLVQALVDRLDGMISNDKFCCTRWGVLQLSWWRRPSRLRRSTHRRGILLRLELTRRRRNP